MLSKIIKKEKETQNKWLEIRGCVAHEEEHRKNLINLKEYMAAWLTEMWDLGTDYQNWIDRLTEDIEELNKMIEKYDVLLGADE